MSEKSNLKCNACGKAHESMETMIRPICKFTNLRANYCDTLCFKWRYCDPKFNLTRYGSKLRSVQVGAW